MMADDLQFVLSSPTLNKLLIPSIDLGQKVVKN